MTKNIFTVDIGGTFTKYALVDNLGNLTNHSKFKTPATYGDLLHAINETYTILDPDIKTICISSPCNYYDGALRGSSFVEYLVDKDIIGDLKETYDIDILIENDGNCAALCENWIGKGKDVNSLVTLVVGSGIGGGVILGNHLLKGSTNLGGDIGYMLLGNTHRNSEGTANCLGILGATKYNYEQGSKVREIRNVEEIFDEKENIDLIKIKEEMCKALAIGAINCKYMLDVDIILFGGEISKHPEFLSSIRKEIDNAIDDLSGFAYKPQIDTNMYFNESNLIGAASLYFAPIKKI